MEHLIRKYFFQPLPGGRVVRRFDSDNNSFILKTTAMSSVYEKLPIGDGKAADPEEKLLMHDFETPIVDRQPSEKAVDVDEEKRCDN